MTVYDSIRPLEKTPRTASSLGSGHLGSPVLPEPFYVYSANFPRTAWSMLVFSNDLIGQDSVGLFQIFGH